MSSSPSALRPAGKSVGAAVIGLIATLIIFVAVFISFLVAPLIALGLGFVAYTMMKPRAGSAAPAGGTAPPADVRHGFGSGTR